MKVEKIPTMVAKRGRTCAPRGYAAPELGGIQSKVSVHRSSRAVSARSLA